MRQRCAASISRTSNEEWKNPHDPQAKVGHTKDGACEMTYMPEHVTDLESGAIVQAEVLEGDHADTRALSERVACAAEVVKPHRGQRGGCRRARRSLRARVTLPSRKLPVSRSSTFAQRSGCPRCAAPHERFGRPAMKSSSSCRLCRQEPVWQGAFAQARYASGTQLRARP